MREWTRNEQKTSDMRLDPHCPPDAVVFDNGEFTAFVLYADLEPMRGFRWHLILGSEARKPDFSDAAAAREQLLPGIKWAVMPGPDVGVYSLHVCEITEKPEQPEGRRWRWLQ